MQKTVKNKKKGQPITGHPSLYTLISPYPW